MIELLNEPTPAPDALYAFLASIEAGYVHPSHMVAVLHAMHAVMVDRFPAVELWMPTSLEQTADVVTNAIGCAERQEQDNPEVTI